MDNLKDTGIYIINIDAERLVNPNRSIEEKELRENEIRTQIENLKKNNTQGYTLSYLEEIIENVTTSTRTDFYEVKEEQRDSIYSGSLPLSLDILKLKELAPNEFYTKIKKRKIYKGGMVNRTDSEKLYTDALISVTFDRASYESLDELRRDLKVIKNKIDFKNVYKGKSNKSARDLREKLYEEGVILRFEDTLVEYVRYKRSSSKAREGSHLFIKKELKDAMSDWYKFGVHFEDGEKDVPLAAIKAYESLTASGIEKIIKIRPNEILLIDDVIKSVEISASVTTQCENGDIVAEDNDKYLINNNIWDGQSLADTSLFDDEESTSQKGMMLLRNSFFKSCAFNTNIQKWFDDAFSDNKPEILKDMFGREVRLADIKLITTPSSLKFLKFADKFDGDNKEERQRNCYEKWLEAMTTI